MIEALFIVVYVLFMGAMNRIAGHSFEGTKYEILDKVLPKHVCMGLAAIATGILFQDYWMAAVSAASFMIFRALSGGEKNMSMDHDVSDYTDRDRNQPWVWLADRLYVPLTESERNTYGRIVGAFSALPLLVLFGALVTCTGSIWIALIGLLPLLRGYVYTLTNKIWGPTTSYPEYLEFVLLGTLLVIVNCLAGVGL